MLSAYCHVLLSSNPGDSKEEMDKAVLPQKILSWQICAQCCNYLSVGPVKVCASKKICGRCTKQDHKAAQPSMYDQIATTCIFKCVNHYTGCKELLAYNEAIQHEEICKRDDIKCPYCDFEGNGCQLVHHFEAQHLKYSTAKDNVFPISLDSGLSNFVFTQNDNIFCVSISRTDKYINISNLLVTHTYSDLKLFKLIFYNPGSCVQYVTPQIPLNMDQDLFSELGNFFPLVQAPLASCFPTGMCRIKVEFIVDETSEENALWQRYLTKVKSGKGYIDQKVEIVKQEGAFDRLSDMNETQLKQFVSKELNELQVCVTCGRQLRKASDIYLCLKHHLSCKSCVYKKCPKCNSFSHWNRPKFDHLSLACDWEGCSEHVNIFEFLVHKQRCQYRRYKCPDVRCPYDAALDDFMKHWHMAPYRSQNMIECNGNEAFYCLIPCVNEFVFVTAETTTHTITKTIVINVCEEHVFLRNSYDLELHCPPSSISYPLLKWKNSRSGVGRTASFTISWDRSESFGLSFKKKF